MVNDAPIGVFDSGVGGLTVIKELMNLLPGENLIYFGDTARVPYGSRPTAEITQFTEEMLQFLSTKEIKMAVMACNAITTVCHAQLRSNYSFPVIGMNLGVDRAVQLSTTKRVGVIATVATIRSGLHERAIVARDAQFKVYPVGCPKFVPLIEKGVLDGEQIDEAMDEYLLPLKEAGVDVLILACTHYPFIMDAIGRIMGKEVNLINPAYETAKDVVAVLKDSYQLAGRKQGSVELCFSAGVEQAERMAGHLFNTRPVKFTKINLQDFCQCSRNFEKNLV